MKKLVLAALLASFTFGASAAEKINFGVSATYPPFESIGANNEIVGFDIDLAKALCKQMQAECTFTNHAFDSLIPSLKFRKYDAVISGMDITCLLYTSCTAGAKAAILALRSARWLSTSAMLYVKSQLSN